MENLTSTLASVLIPGHHVAVGAPGGQETLPERQLLSQVFLKAIDDLKSDNLKHQYSAAEFLAGPVAEEYIGHLGLPEWTPKLALLIHAQCDLRSCLEIPDDLEDVLSRYRPAVRGGNEASL
ncbi:conserved hypothetical protein [Halomonas sp. A3H3]|jgi:hypothetical protein|uniref:hypothetical protein n=1 Tax=Halomonas sp. A3H3 TaxID=1346287 RepID=UPI00038C8BAE|nr:hypothetical protein [Halomonas sp. A3H3]CDG56146.1 conserved hypothetical protein [Halomonas sp. A3H3]